MANAHERFMRIAMEEARRSATEGNVAVGSVVVHGENVVARRRNLVATESDPTAHTETVAFRNAGAAMGHTDFSGFTLYTTFEPCPMCCGAILASGVSTLVLGAPFSDVSQPVGRLRGGEAAREDRTKRPPARHCRRPDRAVPRSATTGNVMSRHRAFRRGLTYRRVAHPLAARSPCRTRHGDESMTRLRSLLTRAHYL